MKISTGPHPIIHPNPVLVVGTYNPDGKPNIMIASWGGICCSQPPCIAVSMRKATQTWENIVKNGGFTISIPSEKYMKEADYAGLSSGKVVDKFKETGLTAVPSELVKAPYVAEFPFNLECKLIKTIELGLHTQFIGEILDLKADEDVLDSDKQPDIEKVRPLIWGSFGSNYYYGIGDRLGKTFSIGHTTGHPTD
jgi:flavin reductase (DIM6/NTAB) family NADH-FMN oxidoreductase RutF